MAITFVNIWETKILDTIRTFLNAEFAGSIPVYTGNFKDMGNQSIRLNPIGSDLIEALFFNNQNNTFFNGRFNTARINEKEEAEEAIEGLNVVRWEWRASYMGNIS